MIGKRFSLETISALVKLSRPLSVFLLQILCRPQSGL
jgi:hypothetical protein